MFARMISRDQLGRLSNIWGVRALKAQHLILQVQAGTVRGNPWIIDVISSLRGLTLQLFGKLGNFLLVVIVSPSGALQAEFPSSDFILSLHHLVFYLLNLALKSGDLGGKPVTINFQVTDCLGEYVGFNLSGNSGGLLLIQLYF
jgi:hypothetical protein